MNLHDFTLFVVDIHQIRLISLFRHFPDHFHFHGSAGLIPKVNLSLRHIIWVLCTVVHDIERWWATVKMSECELCLYHWEKFYIRGTSIGPKCRDPLTLREFWDHKRWNSGKKKAIFGVIWRGSGEIWDSATPPTYIWDQCPKKTCLF